MSAIIMKISGINGWKYPVGIFIIIKIATFLVAYSSFSFIGTEPPPDHFLWHGITERYNLLIEIWRKWDSFWFLNTVNEGYKIIPNEQSNVICFPLFPLLIKLFTFVGNSTVAGIIIVNLSFLVAIVLLFYVVKEEFGEQYAERTILYLAIFPTSFIYSMVYSESVFLMFIAATFYFAWRGNWMLAGISGMFATMTRLVGIILPIVMIINYLEKIGFAIRRIKPNIFWLTLIPLGTIITGIIQNFSTGEPLGFLKMSSYWGAKIAYPWEGLKQWLVGIILTPYSSNRAKLLIDLIFTFAFLLISILSFRRLKPSYTAYIVLTLLMLLCSNRLLGIPRYLITVFPIFILFGIWGERKWFNLGYIIISSSLFALFLILFENWYISF